jgi:putative acetyltransferase
MVEYRPERPEDVDGIRNVHSLAFAQGAEAALVDRLRAGKALIVSMVAVEGDEVLAHCAFSRVGLEDGGGPEMFGLGPMGVRPDHQNQGIGSGLVEASLRACKEAGAVAIVCVGHPEYYPRFGFQEATGYGLTCEFPVPEQFFMAIELEDGALDDVTGRIRYSPEFGKL